MCRFETGELDSYLPEVQQLTLETPFSEHPAHSPAAPTEHTP
jgi:hypothetical protein